MKSFCVGIFAVMAVLAGTAFSAKTCSHDHFYEMFKNKVPLGQIISAVYSNDAVTQYQHFEAVQKHIDDNDEYAEYATSLKAAVQRIIDAKFKEINHGQGHIDINEYMKAAKDLESGVTLENEDLTKVVNAFKKSKEKLMNASEEEQMAHFNQLMQIATGGVIDQQNVQKHHAPHHRHIHFTQTPSSEHSEENTEE